MRLLACLLLSGCAITPGPTASNSYVCYLWATGGPMTSQNAYNELKRRQYSCTEQDLMAARARVEQNSANDAAAAALILNSRPAPLPAPPAPQRNCTTQVINGVAYTSCN